MRWAGGCFQVLSIKSLAPCQGHRGAVSVCCHRFSSPHHPSPRKSLARPDSILSSARLEAQRLSPVWTQRRRPALRGWSGTPRQEVTFVQGQPLQEVTFELRSERGASHSKIWRKSVLGRRSSKGKGPEVEASLVPLGKGRKQHD